MNALTLFWHEVLFALGESWPQGALSSGQGGTTPVSGERSSGLSHGPGDLGGLVDTCDVHLWAPDACELAAFPKPVEVGNESWSQLCGAGASSQSRELSKVPSPPS